MNSPITPADSDAVLNFLIGKIALGDDKDFTSDSFPVPGLNADTLDVLIQDLHDRGLIELLNRGHSGYAYSYDIALTKKGIDFQRLGGFAGVEMLFRKNLEKLVAELEEIRASVPEKADALALIAGDLRKYLDLLL